jgi:hypothetical protein
MTERLNPALSKPASERGVLESLTKNRKRTLRISFWQKLLLQRFYKGDAPVTLTFRLRQDGEPNIPDSPCLWKSGCALESERHKIGDWGNQTLYKKINVEIMVVADEAEAVVAELNVVLDLMEERYAILGDGIETVAFEHSGTPRRSALAHAIAAGGKVAGAASVARESVAVAHRAII